MSGQDPNGYFPIAMHAGVDLSVLFRLTNESGTAIDLTGCSFRAEGRDDDGTSQWEVTPTAASPTNGEITMVVPSATTAAKKGLSGEWGLRVTWTSGLKTLPVWGRWAITSIVLVD